MNILGLAASPRRNGSSSTLMLEALTAARECGATVEQIHLAELNLDFCTGCMSCLSGEWCIQNDGLVDVLRRMLAADGFILSCPTYAMLPSALMKNFMDRIGIWNAYRSALAGKYVLSISTAGAAGAVKTARIVAGICDGFFGYGITSGLLGVRVGRAESKDTKQRARRLGMKLVHDAGRRRKAPFAKVPDKIIGALVLKPMMAKNLMSNREGSMKGVYEYCLHSGRIRLQQPV